MKGPFRGSLSLGLRVMGEDGIQAKGPFEADKWSWVGKTY
jgi:hypothetical protein